MAMHKTRITHTPMEALWREPFPKWKRALDVLVAAVGLSLFLPLGCCIAAYIRFASPGPVYFLQERVGYLGRRFTIYKFRTMHANVDTIGHRKHMETLIAEEGVSASGNGGRPMEKLQDDDRIIPGGNFLRKSHLDEVPQLWNVLRGEMSLVGPRPPIAYEVNAYCQWHTARLDAVPGMTGLWQINGKNQTTFREMVRYDIRYARERSLRLDLTILVYTALLVVKQMLGWTVRTQGDSEEVPQST